MKKSVFGKLWSAMLALALVCGLFGPAAVQTQAADEALTGVRLLAHYEFKNGGEDSSGNGNDAIIGDGVKVSDGIASLPGGESSDSSYITLPKGMFDNQDTLTISMWLRDKDPQDAWLGAFFFGNQANANGYPTNYYYFVPCEKQHNSLKSVITDSVNEAAPFNTEKGIVQSFVKVNTAVYRGEWTHYAVVLEPGSMTCYIDGEAVGSAALARKVSDFGTGLDAYIGKSNYADPLYQGDFKDFRVYSDALSEEQIRTVMGRHPDERAYSMTIDGNKVKKQLSDSLYGLFYEDINSAADGGLYPEMVKNYSFENAYVQSGDTGSDYFKQNGYQTIGNYKLHWDVTGSFEVSDEAPLNEKNPHYAVITGNGTLRNGGFAPQSDPNGAAMPVKPVNAEEKAGVYTFSVYAKADAGYAGTVKVKLVDASGKDVTDERTVPVKADGTWNKVSTELTSKVDVNTKGKMVLTVTGAALDDRLNLDMVSIVPHDSYGYGDKNYAYGVGIRRDLLDLMMDLNPKFLRFPGGCIVEGFNWEGLYDWRDSVGPLEERKACTNRWENWNNQNRTWGYMQSYGFGYHELLTLCEDYGIEAFPILSAGVLCQYETSGVDAKTGDELQRFVDMATDLLDYCWGDAASNEWAAKRAQNGHPEPFDLKYLGIGNENFQAKYFDNLDVIKKAVEDYAKKNYPDRILNIISSAGPTSSGSNLEYAYDRLAQTMPGETLVDEHYYESESFMYNQSDRYDYYQRTEQGGSNVFVGEYAVKNDNKFNTALAEAAYITGLERNADVVTNISYAPLLYKVGSLSWSHDLIYFDEFDTAKSANYYVQQMFAQNYGTQLIGTELEAEGKDYSNYGSPILGTNASEGYIDKVTVYDEQGNVLLAEDFDDNANGWTRFGNASGSAKFEIRDGRLYFEGTSGTNAVYLPKAVEEKWKNFKIVVEGAVKTAGNNGFVVGAGYESQYYWYNMGKNRNKGVYMEVTRAYRGETELTTKELGNNYANRHYNQEKLTQLQTDDPMEIIFNYGINGKLEGSYTSRYVSKKETAKYDFSSELNQYQTDIYQVVTKDDENVYIKLVNPDNRVKTMELDFQNLKLAKEGFAEITVLTAGLDDANAIGNEKVSPETEMKNMTDGKLEYVLPKQSVNVIRVPLSKEEEPKVTKAELESMIADTEKLDASKYTADSWAALQKAVDEARAVLAQSGDSDRDMSELYDKVSAARKALREKQTKTEKPQEAAAVKLNITKLTLGVKEKAILKAAVLPAGVSQNVTWKSSKPSVVKVSASGAVQAKKTGKAVITAVTANGKSSSCTVTVKKAPKKLSLNAKKKTLKRGKTFRIKVKFPKKTWSNKITYQSGKKKVASVSPDGVVTAKKKGTAVITVKTFNGKKAKLTVKVK